MTDVMGRARFAAVAAAMLLAGGGLAQAQGAPVAGGDEAYCIYDSWSDEQVMLVADNFVDPREDEAEEIELAYSSAGDACAARHGWDAERRRVAEDMAHFTAVIDIIGYDMEAEGLKSADVIGAVWDKLPVEDRTALKDKNWTADAALDARVKAAVIAAGVMDTPEMIDSAGVMLAAISLVNAAVAEWNAIKK